MFSFSFCCRRKAKQDTNPPVHVLMPLYNAKRFVCASVQSILDQTYSNFKIFIIDDGSNDEGLEHLNSYLRDKRIPDSRVQIQRSDLNRGVSRTRKELFDWSRKINPHAYTLWLDSDDTYNDKNFVSKILTQMLNTQADICLYNFSIEFEDKSQQSNAMVLMKDKEKIAGILQTISTSPKQVVNPIDLPNLLNFTSLGWTKCYSPRMNLPIAADCPYEDFVYMAALLQADRITALPADYEPITYLRRSTSICGQRKHTTFSYDIPTQLLTFFETINTSANANRLKKLEMAQSFVTNKLIAYKEMLKKFVNEKTFVGIDDSTLNIFSKEAERITQRIKNVLSGIEEKEDSRLAEKVKSV